MSTPESAGKGTHVTVACPRCSHSCADHWPDHLQPTTACFACLKSQTYTVEPEGSRYAKTGPGICCYPSTTIHSESPLTPGETS